MLAKNVSKKLVSLISGDSVEGNVSNDGHTEANITEGDSIAVGAAADIGQFLRKFYDNVSGAYSIDAGINLSNGNAGDRMHSDASIARNTRANAGNSGKRTINENYHK